MVQFDPATDIPDLTGKTILVTGGKYLAAYMSCDHFVVDYDHGFLTATDPDHAKLILHRHSRTRQRDTLPAGSQESQQAHLLRPKQ